jgi:broad specificity phosphatase PhoE
VQPFAALVYAFAPAAMRAPWSLIDAEPPKRALERAAAACAALGVPLLISVDDMLQVRCAMCVARMRWRGCVGVHMCL